MKYSQVFSGRSMVGQREMHCIYDKSIIKIAMGVFSIGICPPCTAAGVSRRRSPGLTDGSNMAKAVVTRDVAGCRETAVRYSFLVRRVLIPSTQISLPGRILA